VTRFKLCRGHHHQYCLAVASTVGGITLSLWASSGGVNNHSGDSFLMNNREELEMGDEEGFDDDDYDDEGNLIGEPRQSMYCQVLK